MRELQKKNILVIGDVMLDRYQRGNVKRISPEAPVPVFWNQPGKETCAPGGASNVAVNLVAAGQHVSVMSILGNDEAGNKILEILEAQGIDTELMCKFNRPTTVKTRLLAANNQQVLRIDSETVSQITDEEEKILLDKLKDKIADFDIIVISDYSKGLLTEHFTQKVIEFANNKKIRVLIDVKDPNINKYCGAFLLKPNQKELHDLTGCVVDNPKNIVDASRKLIKECKSEYVLTTLGADGMALISKEFSYFIPSVKKEVFDVTGAGDTTIAYLTACIANDFSVREAVNISNYAAGVQVGKVGTSTVSWNEVQNLISSLKENRTAEILSQEEIKKFREDHTDQTIVFTNGCFDILHAGHVSYLKQAASLGDVLIVGLNDDDSVHRLKGDGRPVNRVNDRATVIGALECVDYVAVFSEDTPYNLIKAIQPDILVKGGDYKPDQVVGKDIVEAAGGKVEILPFVQGKSTTSIINKIKE